MGQGIAQVLACSGVFVTLVDLATDQLERALQTTQVSVDKLKAKGQVAQSLTPLEFIDTSTDMEAVAHCDLVIEAVTEDEVTKRAIFQTLNNLCAATTVLASNTSSISITRLAAAIDHPERLIGVHFMNPVPLMPLIEVIKSKHTDQSVIEGVLTLAQAIGKTAVVVKDRPAFVLNRILLPTLNEAIRVVEEGTASAQQVDQIMTLGAGFPMGPLALADMIGLDTCLHILDLMFVELKDPRYLPASLLRDKVMNGQLGRKNGAGFYDYAVS